jgi:hypothetical protein
MREKPGFPANSRVPSEPGPTPEWLAGAAGFGPLDGELEIGRYRPSKRSRKISFRLGS